MKSTFTICFLVVASLFTQPAKGQLDFDFSEGDIQDGVAENPWSGSFAAGLNGKSGNSQNLDLNLALNLARETDVTNTTLLATYFYSTNEIATVTDRFFGQARRERKLHDSRLNLYFQAAYEWDRFKAFDYRIALHSGLGFEFYKIEEGFLKFRFGAGASKEVGAILDDWIPELQFGGDWEHQLTSTVKLLATTDYYPSLDDFADFRLNTNAGFEFVVDAPRDINFRIFTFNRYDNTPAAGNVKNDIDYGMAFSVGI